MPVVIKYRASSSVPEGSGPLFACEADALVRVPQYLLERLLTLMRLCSARSWRRAASRFSSRRGTSTRSILIGGPALSRCCPNER